VKAVVFKAYKHQLDAVEFHLERKYSINAFSMGLGKTLVALLMKQRLGVDTLVVCPAYLKHNWLAEAQKFLGTTLGLTVLSYNKFNEKVEVLPRYKFVIFDEAHYLKNPKAQRTKAAHGYMKDVLPDHLLLLSGTPIKNGVSEFWSLLKLCSYGPKQNRLFLPYQNSQYRFCDYFCRREYTFGQHFKFTGLRHGDELRTLVRPWYLRKRAGDVLDLPAQVRKKINIAPDKHDKGLEEAWAAYSNGKVSEHMSTAKAVNALAKVTTTVELAGSIIEGGQQVVVFSDHIKACEDLYSGLSDFAAGGIITGATTVNKRTKTIEDFRDGKLAFIVATIGAMSVGVNLQTASHMVFNDYPWVPADLAQAEKRIHRIGQTSTCFYYYVFASDIDEQIYDKLVEKLQIITEVVDGDSNPTSD
jgi:SWI/SNF-related matrix-associated actin-dependent regulator 1 of chromatin subfamily A